MSYYLEQKPDTYCPIKEREDMLEAILVAAESDSDLFSRIEDELYFRRPDEISKLIHDAYKGIDICESVDKLIEEVAKECLRENIDYFGEWE